MSKTIPDASYRCPGDLGITPSPIRRVLLTGQCLMAGWPGVIQEAKGGCPCDFVLSNNAMDLPEHPPRPFDEYDLQIVQVPLRSIVPEGAYFRLSYADRAAYETLFADAKAALHQLLASAMRWNVAASIPTFVVNFTVPQQNPMGRMLPRYDLRNFAHFVEKLNEALAAELASYANAYLFDFDQIVATFGRRYFQDDVLWQENHNGALTDSDFENDHDRIEPAGKASNYYPVRTHDYLEFAWSEVLAMYRTLIGADRVKLVVFDIDDTLWRGVAAESPNHRLETIEGWPLGLAEAIGYLKRRGIILALLSKNDELRVADAWNNRLGMHRLSFDDFAIRKINWQPKVENFEAILREANLLAESVVYVDDNPAERASIQAAFPQVRTLGGSPLLWRRILLWSSETQVPSVTSESSERSSMVRAQVSREQERSKLSREEFLQSLALSTELVELSGAGDPRFARCFELLNKTNQFNSTGRRWTQSECRAALERGARFFVFSAADRFTQYGIIGVAISEGCSLTQFVMSCRVVGLGIEFAVLAALLPAIAGEGDLVASLDETESNALARDFYEKVGFQPASPGRWIRSATPPLVSPSHIEMRFTSRGPTAA